MSFDLDLNDIRYICGDVMYNRAMDMYLRNKVRAIRVHENSEHLFSAAAVVQAAYDVNEYNINVTVNNRNLRVYAFCNCKAFEEYKMCKHVGAVLIKINKDGSYEKSLGLTKSQEEELIEAYKTSFERDVKGVGKENINLEITLVVEEEKYGDKKKNYYLEFKIGNTKTYVVKNIKELIENIYITGGTITYGKELEFNYASCTFRSKEKELLDMIKDIYDLSQEVANKLYTNRAMFFTGKRVLLTLGHLKRIFNIMAGEKITLSYQGRIYKEVEISKGKLPISFYMFLKGEKLNVDLNGEIPQAISEEGGLFFINNSLYILSEKEKNDFLPLYKFFSKKQNKSISFKEEEISDVANYLLPKLEEISPVVIKAEEVREIIKEQPLTAKFYLDYDKKEEKVLCEVKFLYGSEEEQSEEKKVIRNLKEEQKKLEKLHGLNFKGEGLVLSMSENEDLIELLTYGIEELKEEGEVFYSDAFKNMKVISKDAFKAGIRLNDVDLLEFDFSIEGISEEEMKEALEAIKERKKYHRLKDGSLLALHGQEVRDIQALMENFDISSKALAKGEVTIPKYASLYLEDKISNGSLFFINRNNSFQQLISNIKNIKDNSYEVPKVQQGILRNYQELGFKWFKTLGDCGFGGILGDEMGLGKTLQAITYITSEKEGGKLSNKALIVCPTSLIYNWSSEFEKFSKDLKIAVVNGSKKEREAFLKDVDAYDVFITSYALLRRDIELYDKFNFDICIIDEAQYIKNPASQNASSVKEVKAKKKFAMTGTPIENSLTELWSIFDFIMPGYLKTHGRFLKEFEVPIVKDKDEEALKELLKLIKPFILRRFKKEVVTELPPKIEHKIIVDMTKEQKKLYTSYVDKYKEEMKEEIATRGLNKSKIKLLSLLTRLRQLCCDPGSFIEDYTGDSGKYVALYDILEEALENNHKVLLFSQFTTILNTIRCNLKKKGINTMYLDGSVPAKERINLVNEFNEGPPGVFLISLKAGGTGLNLTSADTVIHFDPWWNPAVEEQAVDRAHRIGQKNTVEVIKLIARGTIEEKIYKIQENKKAIIEKVLDGEEHVEVTLSSMTEEEIEDLFKV